MKLSNPDNDFIMLLIMSSKEIVSVIAASLVLVAGGIWLIRRKFSRRWTRKDEPEVQMPLAPEPQIPLKEQTPPPVERLEAVAMRIADSDLSEFMRDITTRVRDEGPDFGEATSMGYIEEMVDRLDDLRTIQKNHQGKTAKDVELFRQTLTEVLSDCGVELLHSDEWDPSIQRAIAKEPTPGIDTPTILRFGSTGIRRHAQLVRKQEVVLAVPQ